MKNKPTILAASRISLGVITFGAVMVQLIHSIRHGRDIANFFSFFTIESNILAAALLIALGIYQIIGKKIIGTAYYRGAMTLYMTMTGIIYALLLSGNEVALQTTLPGVNFILHYLVPLLILVDWLAFPPSERLSWRVALLWLLYPFTYLLYSLVRGSFTGWYPYPFINPVTNGWPNVIGMSLTLAVGIVLLTLLLVFRTSRHLRRRTV